MVVKCKKHRGTTDTSSLPRGLPCQAADYVSINSLSDALKYRSAELISSNCQLVSSKPGEKNFADLFRFTFSSAIVE
jgi:hypothetical protein